MPSGDQTIPSPPDPATDRLVICGQAGSVRRDREELVQPVHLRLEDDPLPVPDPLDVHTTASATINARAPTAGTTLRKAASLQRTSCLAGDYSPAEVNALTNGRSPGTDPP